jgi:5-methylcytosine-specific restriction endonuclease McrA
MNNWHIPPEMENDIRTRDKSCVYCALPFSESKRPTWEHIINDEKIITSENIALCCRSCNSSKGAKKLSDWMNSKYCHEKGINYSSVSKVIQTVLDRKW